MSRLVIKFPTRGRPEKFKEVFSRYLSMLSGKHSVQFVITMDEDDETMNNPKMRQWLATRQQNADIQFYFGHSKTKVEAVNADLSDVDGDVLLLASDDMYPVMVEYDDIIFSAFAHSFPNFDGAIKFWDGFRRREDLMMTLAVLGFPLYRKFGYIYHPEYKSLYCDEEQTYACMMAGKLAKVDICIIQHIWTAAPFDPLHARNESKGMYARDGAVFEVRKSKNFFAEALLS